MDLSSLPAFNAGINATNTLLLIAGIILVKQRALKAHSMCMATATLLSVIFLMSYITYHYYHGTTIFPGSGAIRVFYLTVLFTHTVLAMVVVPLVIMTVFWALRGNFEKHRKWGKITFPVWLYVSVTGVMIYWMLYQMDFS